MKFWHICLHTSKNIFRFRNIYTSKMTIVRLRAVQHAVHQTCYIVTCCWRCCVGRWLNHLYKIRWPSPPLKFNEQSTKARRAREMVIVAIFFLVAFVPVPSLQRQNIRSVSVCEKDPSPLIISCSSGFLIHVTAATYGRTQDDICPHPTAGSHRSCIAKSSLRLVSTR